MYQRYHNFLVLHTRRSYQMILLFSETLFRVFKVLERVRLSILRKPFSGKNGELLSNLLWLKNDTISKKVTEETCTFQTFCIWLRTNETCGFINLYINADFFGEQYFIFYLHVTRGLEILVYHIGLRK